jgi:tripartite-type tricarboxylate transporter receptor subunit TctC
MTRTALTFFALCAVTSPFGQRSLAQVLPASSIRIIVGQTPGGQSDLLARLVGEHLSRLARQPVVIDNRAGAGGTIGADMVAQAPPDGSTLLFAGSSNLVLAAALGEPLRYDPTADFAPLGRVAHVPLVLVVHSKVEATTLAELIAVAKARPGALTYGSVGSGAMTRLAVELLKTSAGIDILEVPYRGVAPALADLLAGRIDMMFFDLALVAPHVKAGSLRLIAAAGQRRAPGAPDLPTVAEQGIPGFSVEPWYGLVAPAKLPPDVLERLRSTVAEVRRQPDFQQRLKELAYEPINDTPQQFASDMAAEIRKFTAVVKTAGIKGTP